MKRRGLSGHLHNVWSWTDAAGEIDELRRLEGDELSAYCADSAANYARHGFGDEVSESDLIELSEWLKKAG